ncbi:MAG: ComEC/Rec2 family competence protein, partial [Caldilineaceae bacterium]|nr:ComEC/Rec2 family competence protein [Caldilineaceae bacterium]
MTLLYLALTYIIGIVLGQLLWNANWVGCNFPTWLWCLPLLLLPISPLFNRLPLGVARAPHRMRWPIEAGFVVPRDGPSPALLVACTLCLCMGILRYIGHPLTPCWTSSDLAFHNLPADRAFARDALDVTVVGYVGSYPLRADTKQEFHVQATKVVTRDGIYAVHGIARLTTGVIPTYHYGQPIKVSGRLTTPPEFEDFSYRAYLARKGVHSLLYGAKIEQLAGANTGNPLLSRLYAVRSRGEQVLNRLLPEPYAALANGMLLGIEAGIPDKLYEQFNLTGTSHTIVISGSNVAIISTLLMAIGLRLLGKRRALWATLGGIGCYALLVGGDAAVLRAAFMGSLYVIAVALERRSTALISLAAACWLMTLINPLTLWDVGFQLSSVATAGLIIFTPGITAFAARVWPSFSRNDDTTQTSTVLAKARGAIQSIIEDGLLVTIAANVTTL